MANSPKHTYPIDMISVFISALVAIYFGYTWLIDPAPNASPEAAKLWMAADHAYRWGLFVCGGALIAAALYAGSVGASAPIVRLLALAEGALGLIFAVMALDTLLEVRGFDIYVLLLTILALYCFRAARDYWRMVRHAAD